MQLQGCLRSTKFTQFSNIFKPLAVPEALRNPWLVQESLISILIGK